MFKTIAMIGLAAALALPSVPAFAVSGNFILLWLRGLRSHRADAVADALPASWNHANESKERARAGAAWIRHQAGYGHRQLSDAVS